ncbi:hypothetical protein HanIR_Chr01g0019891 [Helianthus annuus]|nr:hypothetical protein HanIR_Chr01g0019891 [Helianthus annuus]
MVLYSIIYSVIIHFLHFSHFEHFLQDPLPDNSYIIIYYVSEKIKTDKLCQYNSCTYVSL